MQHRLESEIRVVSIAAGCGFYSTQTSRHLSGQDAPPKYWPMLPDMHELSGLSLQARSFHGGHGNKDDVKRAINLSRVRRKF